MSKTLLVAKHEGYLLHFLCFVGRVCFFFVVGKAVAGWMVGNGGLANRWLGKVHYVPEGGVENLMKTEPKSVKNIRKIIFKSKKTCRKGVRASRAPPLGMFFFIFK